MKKHSPKPFPPSSGGLLALALLLFASGCGGSGGTSGTGGGTGEISFVPRGEPVEGAAGLIFVAGFQGETPVVIVDGGKAVSVGGARKGLSAPLLADNGEAWYVSRPDNAAALSVVGVAADAEGQYAFSWNTQTGETKRFPGMVPMAMGGRDVYLRGEDGSTVVADVWYPAQARQIAVPGVPSYFVVAANGNRQFAGFVMPDLLSRSRERLLDFARRKARGQVDFSARATRDVTAGGAFAYQYPKPGEDAGQPVFLQGVAGSAGTFVTSINASGLVGGGSRVGDATEAAVWDWTAAPTALAPGGPSTVTDVSDAGQVVGGVGDKAAFWESPAARPHVDGRWDRAEAVSKGGASALLATLGAEATAYQAADVVRG